MVDSSILLFLNASAFLVSKSRVNNSRWALRTEGTETRLEHMPHGRLHMVPCHQSNGTIPVKPGTHSAKMRTGPWCDLEAWKQRGLIPGRRPLPPMRRVNKDRGRSGHAALPWLRTRTFGARPDFVLLLPRHYSKRLFEELPPGISSETGPTGGSVSKSVVPRASA